VTDAWIASIVESLSEHLVTLDRDFIRLLPKSDLTILR
jgi:predicted nucleic acid-binding protein